MYKGGEREEGKGKGKSDCNSLPRQSSVMALPFDGILESANRWVDRGERRSMSKLKYDRLATRLPDVKTDSSVLRVEYSNHGPFLSERDRRVESHH